MKKTSLSLDRHKRLPDTVDLGEARSTQRAVPSTSAASTSTVPCELLSRKLEAAVRLNRMVGAFVPDRFVTCREPWGIGRGPLQCIAIGIKDNIRTTDFDSTYGADIPADPRDRFDADIVKALRDLGAAICGKTAMAEFALFRAPATRNPKAWMRTPGGSSSGSAAAVAAGMVPMAIGTQTAGSVIRPAAFCGVVGFKPTFGVLSCQGVQPLAPSLDTLGLFAGSVTDVLHIAQYLLPRESQGDSCDRTLRLGYCATWSNISVAHPVKVAVESALLTLRAHGLSVECINLPATLMATQNAHSTVMGYEAVRSLRPWSNRRPTPLSTELQTYVETSAAITGRAYQGALLLFDEARDCFDHVISQFDAILTPSTNTLPPVGLTSTGSSAMNRLWTAVRAPVLTLPLPRPSGRIPIGLQIIGRRGGDIRMLEVARVLERALAIGTEHDHESVS